jgi:hypothetical protein
MPNRRDAPRANPQPKADTRAEDAVTIGWMLCMITTLVCEIGAAATQLYVLWFDTTAKNLAIFSGLVQFAAVVFGLLTLIGYPLVRKVRRDPVPRSIAVFALGVGLAPVAIVLLSALV